MFTLGASTGTPSQVRINSKPKEQLCNYHKLSSLKPKSSVTRLCSHRKAFPAPEEAWCSTARLCSEIDTWQGSLPNTTRPQVSQSHLNNQIWSPRSFKCLQNCDFISRKWLLIHSCMLHPALKKKKTTVSLDIFNVSSTLKEKAVLNRLSILIFSAMVNIIRMAYFWWIFSKGLPPSKNPSVKELKLWVWMKMKALSYHSCSVI